MKKILLSFALVAFFGLSQAFGQQRYLDEVFTNVDVTRDIIYQANISVLTGTPQLDTFRLDFYEPQGDTSTARPLILVAHTGSFLPPPINGQCTGVRQDWTVEMLCTMLAKRGFVAAAFSYRQGWNPASTVQEERTGTLLNAAYRGIQDGFTAVRFFRTNSATYGIDVNRVTMGGVGTGGYLSLGCTFLSDYDEISLAKFIDPNTLTSFVDTMLSGDIEGKLNRTLQVGNYVNENSEIQFAFNMGGAVGDSSWIEAGEGPMVSFHVPSDPFAPYGFGAVIVPTTQEFVVNVSGSQGVQSRNSRLGNNNSFNSATYNDPYTTAANAVNGGIDGLFPFNRPGVESGPWEYFDSTNCPSQNVAASLQTNPDMSIAKATAYLDTIVNYLSPRAVCALGLPGCVLTANEDELDAGSVSVFPNPTAGNLYVRSTISGNNIVGVEVLDLAGRSIFHEQGLKVQEYTLASEEMTSGLYFVRVSTRKGTITKKVVFE
ncbi:MAG: T9SS type A sorting domain-containing protein [Bacteroidota bacterium]